MHRIESTDCRGAVERARTGFTMIELIVVIAIVAILASIVVPLAVVFDDRARGEATAEEMRGLETALVAWYEDFGSFPSDLDSLVTAGYLGGEFDSTGHSTDAWFNDYAYTASGMSAGLSSAGADQVSSTADDLSLAVTATVLARNRTRDEMETIHVALRNYENLRVSNGLADLSSTWDGSGTGAMQDLITEGLLPTGAKFIADDWGSTYVYTGSPADYVVSPNVGSGP